MVYFTVYVSLGFVFALLLNVVKWGWDAFKEVF